MSFVSPPTDLQSVVDSEIKYEFLILTILGMSDSDADVLW